MTVSFRSAARLTYKNAQDVIEGKSLGAVPVLPEFDAVDVEHDIRVLHGLAKSIRARRAQAGFLSMSSMRLSFTLDESGLPADCEPYERSDANDLIEEVSKFDRN